MSEDYPLDDAIGADIEMMGARWLEKWAGQSEADESVLWKIAAADNLGKPLLKKLLRSEFPNVRRECLIRHDPDGDDKEFLVANETDQRVLDAVFPKLESPEEWALVTGRPELAAHLTRVWPSKMDAATQAWALNTVLAQPVSDFGWVRLSACLGDLTSEAASLLDLDQLVTRALEGRDYEELDFLLNGAELFPRMPELLVAKTMNADLATRSEVARLYRARKVSQIVADYMTEVDRETSENLIDQGKVLDINQALAEATAETSEDDLAYLLESALDKYAAWTALAQNPDYSANWPSTVGWRLAADTSTMSAFTTVYALSMLTHPEQTRLLLGLLEEYPKNTQSPGPSPTAVAVEALLLTAARIDLEEYKIPPESYDENWRVLLAQVAVMVDDGTVFGFPESVLGLKSTWLQNHIEEVPLILVPGMDGSGAGLWLLEKLLDLSKTYGSDVFAVARAHSKTLPVTATSASLVATVEDFFKINAEETQTQTAAKKKAPTKAKTAGIAKAPGRS